ncbi:hypothetical protein [Hyunsoonleella rubra]|uniref:Secreted protein n=1 Tax=Hyunsoonleella rubra TaxID=1737062 RepID=A0ABW5T9X2_9FLAO
MRLILICIVLFAFASKANAQIDTKKESNRSIPAIISPKDSIDTKKIVPVKPEENDDFKELNAPKVVSKLEFPKKEFSMFPDEEFGNPGELHEKKLKKLNKEVLPEYYGETAGLKEDAFWGDYKTTADYINILVRDYSAIDGDLLHIMVNDDIIASNIYLQGGYKGLKLDLVEGLNRIDFIAVNTGASGPNTAEYKIVDDKLKVISRKVWALEKGIKVTIIILKE